MSTQRILVTGINGFVGKHLVRELHSQGVKVVGTASESANAEIAGLLDSFVACNLTDLESVKQLPIKDVDAVIHLAALSSQGMSFDQPQKFATALDQALASMGESGGK